MSRFFLNKSLDIIKMKEWIFKKRFHVSNSRRASHCNLMTNNTQY